MFQYQGGAGYGMVLSETLPFAAYVLDVCSLTSYALWIHSRQPDIAFILNTHITELQSDPGKHTNELMHTHALFV